MEKIIAARHCQLDEVMKQSITTALDRIANEYRKLTSVRFVLIYERPVFRAEVIVYGKNVQIEADASHPDWQPAVDDAMAKAERQLRRHLERVQDHAHLSVAQAELVQAEKAAAAGS